MSVERTFISDGKMPFVRSFITVLETETTYLFEGVSRPRGGNLTVNNGPDGTPHSASYVLGVGSLSGTFTFEYCGTMPERWHTFVFDGKGYAITELSDAIGTDGSMKTTVTAHELINPLVTFPAVAADLPTMVKDTALAGDNLITCTANSGAGTVAWSLLNGPAGIVIDPSTGAITGTPTVAGAYQLEIIATGDSILNAIDPSTGSLTDAVGYRRYALTVAAS